MAEGGGFFAKVLKALKPDRSSDAKWYRRPKAVYTFYGAAALALLLLIALIIWLLLYEKSYEETCMENINKYRKLHFAEPLVLNSSVTEYAMEWAMRIAGRKLAEYRPDGKYGENIYVGKGYNSVGCDHVVKTWYNEIRDFDWGRVDDIEDIPVGTGHFMQLIWQSTKEMGCAALNSSDYLYVVCDFLPGGNIQGGVYQNIKPLKGARWSTPAWERRSVNELNLIEDNVHQVQNQTMATFKKLN